MTEITDREKRRRRRRNRKTTTERKARRAKGEKKVVNRPGKLPLQERVRLSAKEKHVAKLIALDHMTPDQAAHESGMKLGYIETMMETWEPFQIFVSSLRGERLDHLREDVNEKSLETLKSLHSLLEKYKLQEASPSVRDLRDAMRLFEEIQIQLAKYDPKPKDESKAEKEEAAMTTYDLMLQGLRKAPNRYEDKVLDTLLLSIKEEDIKTLPDVLRKRWRELDSEPEEVRLRKENAELRAEISELKKERRKLTAALKRREPEKPSLELIN